MPSLYPKLSPEVSLYPPCWPLIALGVKERAGWRCEQCGHVHDPEAGYCLTVHHRDGDPGNCADHNLVALCQRCHLAAQVILLGRKRMGALNPHQLSLF